MYTHIAFFRKTVCFICFFSLFAGCKDRVESTRQPQIVSKKIAAQTVDATLLPKALEKVAGTSVDQPAAAEGREDITTPLVLPEIKLVYDPTGKIDPFVPLMEDKPALAEGTQTVKKRRIPLTPLEKVDLSQLRLEGVLLAPNGNRAMVAEASGKGYIVSVGTYIGTQSGRVTQILKDRMIIEEEVENVLGKVTLQNRELKLQKPPGEE